MLKRKTDKADLEQLSKMVPCSLVLEQARFCTRGRSPGEPPRHDLSTWTATDDWPDPVPITEAEIEVLEQWFGDLFDELFGSSDP